MEIPNYYKKYLENEDKFTSVVEYFEILNEDDWYEFVRDLALKNTFPNRIAGLSSAEDILIDFTDIWAGMSTKTLKLLISSINNLCQNYLAEKKEGFNSVINLAIRITNIFGEGIEPYLFTLIIKRQVEVLEENQELAAICMANTNTEMFNNINFSEVELRANPSIVFAKIIATMKTNKIEAIKLLKFIHKPFLHLNQFKIILIELFSYINGKEISFIYFFEHWLQFSVWLKEYIDKEIFVFDEFKNLKNQIIQYEKNSKNLGEDIINKYISFMVKERKVSIIALDTGMFDHESIQYADSLGYFSDLNIKVIYKPLKEYVDIGAIYYQNPNLLMLSSLPRELILSPQIYSGNVYDIAPINTFNLYSLVVPSSWANEFNGQNKDNFENISRMLPNYEVYVLDTAAKKYVNFILDYAGQRYTRIIREPRAQYKLTQDEIIDLLENGDGKQNKFLVVATGPILSLVKEYEGKFGKEVFSSKDMEAILKEKEQPSEIHFWHSLMRHYVHNSWILNIPQDFSEDSKEFIHKIASIAYKTIDDIEMNKDKFIVFLKKLWNANILNVRGKKYPLNEESISYAVKNAYNFIRFKDMRENYFQKDSEFNYLNSLSDLIISPPHALEIFNENSRLIEEIARLKKHIVKETNGKKMTIDLVVELESKLEAAQKEADNYRYLSSYLLLQNYLLKLQSKK